MPTDKKKRVTRQSRQPQTAQPLRPQQSGRAQQGRLFNPSQVGPQTQLFNPDDPTGENTFTQEGGDESAFSSTRPSPTREAEAERDREARAAARRRRLEQAAADARGRGARLVPERSSRLRRGRRGNT